MNTETPFSPTSDYHIQKTSESPTFVDNHSYAVDLFVDAVNWLSIYYSSMLIVTGCVCNPLAFIVYSRRIFRNTSTSIYLRFLSVVDLGAILTAFTTFFVNRAFGVDIRNTTISCPIVLFATGLFVFGSSWTLVIVTTERLISIVWPHHVHDWCSRRTVKVVIVAVIIISSGLRLPFCLLATDVTSLNPLTNTTSTRHCMFSFESEEYLKLLAMVSVTHTTFLPILILSIFNIFIVRGVIQSRKRVVKASMVKPQKKKVPSTPSWQNKCINEASSYVADDEDSLGPSENFNGAHLTETKTKDSGTTAKISGGSRRELSLTITLLVVTTTFVICNLPNAVYGTAVDRKSLGRAGVALGDLLDILMFTNNSINFALYCITGSRFRAEVKVVFRECFTWKPRKD